MFRLYIHANSVNNSKGNKMNVSSGDTTSPSLALDFTMKDLYAIEEIHSDDHLLRLIVGYLYCVVLLLAPSSVLSYLIIFNI